MRSVWKAVAVFVASVVVLIASRGSADPPSAAAPNCHVAVSVPPTCTTSSCRQIARPQDRRCVAQGYLEYTPPGYGDGTQRPLIVMLHGLAENGDGSARALPRLAHHGIPELIANNAWPPVPSAADFIVLSPQHRTVGEQTCPSAREIHAFIDYAKTAYDVDPSRIYLTGLSCGGIGVWNYLAEYADTQGLAAAISIAGDARQAFRRQGCALGRVPTWTFHGERDPGMNVEYERAPITSLQACTPTPEARLTVFPGVGHNAWTRAYEAHDNDIYAWLRAHHR